MMTAGLFSLLLGLWLFMAFALLALTQFIHRRATGLQELSPQRAGAFRAGAAGGLLSGLIAAIWHENSGFGVLLWVGLLSLCAGSVSLVLAWRPGLLAPLARLMARRHLPQR